MVPIHPGGVNQVVINLAHEMRRAGSFEPIILIQDWAARRPQWEDFQGLTTLRWRIRGFRRACNRATDLRTTSGNFDSPGPSRILQDAPHRRRQLHYPGDTAFTFDRVMERMRLGLPLILSFHGADLKGIGAEPLRVTQSGESYSRAVPSSHVHST